MEEQEIAIPFDVARLNENAFHKIYRITISGIKAFIKRIIEIFISLIGLIIFVPLAIVVFFQNVKNKDYGKVLYTQERIGKNGKIFKMYKFRTMVNNADEILENMLKDDEIRAEYEKYRKLRNDPRVTKFGKILREKSLDEFPQFINILKGEMSIVGPRPYLPEEKERMGKYYNYIVQHKPGLTGVFQISGRERVAFSERLDMDLRYHYRRTFLVDLKIALITMLVTLRRKKTYNVGELTLDTLGYISRGFTLFVKRIIDIIGAIVGIAILIPLTVAVWIVNKLNKEEGPLFYSQERIGKEGKHFKMYKFRSMVVDAEERLKNMLEQDEEMRKEFEETRKLRNDPRITKIGNFLRKTSLDEFPQFINVLKGDMSLVGPRAVIDGEIELFGIHKDTVLSVKPGITGYWAANGRSDTSYEERVELETFYAKHMSIPLDIEILAKTVITVVKKEGAI